MAVAHLKQISQQAGAGKAMPSQALLFNHASVAHLIAYQAIVFAKVVMLIPTKFL
jgi:hypothetical protein